MKFTECLNPLSVGAIDHYTYLKKKKKKISKGFCYSKLTMNTRIQGIGITLKNLMGKYTEQRDKNESKKKESEITLIFTSTGVGLIMKNVRIQSFFESVFSVFGLNTEI